MPLFRFHRGGLDESLKTTIIVKTFNDMVKAILDNAEPFIFENKWGAKFSVNPYRSNFRNDGKDECFDARVGWYTQMVTANLYEEDTMHPIGFLSEPF